MNSIKVLFIYESETCRVADKNVPEAIVAHDEFLEFYSGHVEATGSALRHRHQDGR